MAKKKAPARKRAVKRKTLAKTIVARLDEYHPSKFIFYRDTQKHWRWKFKASNGQILADSAEGYVRRIDCERGARYLANFGSAANWVNE